MKLLALLASAVAASAAAVASPQQAQETHTTLYPWGTYRYWVETGEIKEDPQDQLLIVKNGNAADETTTIVAFNVPESAEGKQCELHFELWDRDVSTGSMMLDVFTYQDPPEDTSELARMLGSDEMARGRDRHAGRVQVPKPGVAEWIQSYNGWPRVPCPAGQRIGIEYVGVGDAVEVRWDIGVTGPTFRILE